MKLKEIREMYPEGTQIVLTEMAGESQMPYGLKGTVKFVDFYFFRIIKMK